METTRRTTVRALTARVVLSFALLAGAAACYDHAEPDQSKWPTAPTGQTPVQTPTAEPLPGTPGGMGLVPWIGGHAGVVRSVDADDTEWSDLATFAKAVGDARIVMLGEQSHADGTTFKAKVRLIKFLHETMGFDVVAFEAGAYDSREAWKRILAGDAPVAAARQSIFEIWSYAREVQPLFEYIGSQARGARPLELAGIDPQFTGPVGGGTGLRYADDLEAFLTTRGSTITTASWWPAFRAVVSRMSRQYYRDTALTTTEHDTFTRGSALLRAETARLRSATPAFETGYWAQLSDALDAQERAWWAKPPENTLDEAYKYLSIRDSSMARNLLWLANSGYPGKKIIVWAASQHLATNTEYIRNATGAPVFPDGYVPMTKQVRTTLADGTIYSVGFVAGGGSSGPAGVHSGEIPAPSPIPALGAAGFETLFLGVREPFLFLNLRERKDGGVWLTGTRMASPLGYAPMTASWPDVFDGFFFTAVMEPATRAP